MLASTSRGRFAIYVALALLCPIVTRLSLNFFPNFPSASYSSLSVLAKLKLVLLCMEQLYSPILQLYMKLRDEHI